MARSAKLLFLLGGVSLPLSASVQGETVLLPDAGWRAAWAFRDTCLATRGQGAEAAAQTILARPNTTEGASLPAYGGGKPMRTFTSGSLDYLIRSGKNGKYGCFVALEGDAALAASTRTALQALPGLDSQPAKVGTKVFYEWKLAGSKDRVRLTPQSDLGTILINLEVNS